MKSTISSNSAEVTPARNTGRRKPLCDRNREPQVTYTHIVDKALAFWSTAVMRALPFSMMAHSASTCQCNSRAACGEPHFYACHLL